VIRSRRSNEAELALAPESPSLHSPLEDSSTIELRPLIQLALSPVLLIMTPTFFARSLRPARNRPAPPRIAPTG